MCRAIDSFVIYIPLLSTQTARRCRQRVPYSHVPVRGMSTRTVLPCFHRSFPRGEPRTSYNGGSKMPTDRRGSEGSAPAPSRSRCRHGRRNEGTSVEGSPIRSRVVHACGGDVRQGQDNEPCHVLELTCAYQWTTLVGDVQRMSVKERQ